MTHVCDYCRGPIVGDPVTGRAGEAYCCYGCLSVGDTEPSSIAFDGPTVRLGVGALVAAQSMVFGLAVSISPPDSATRFLVQGTILLSTLLVIGLLGVPLFRAAWQPRVTIEALFSLTLIGAFAASMQSFLTGGGPVYFEVVSVLLVVYTLGKMVGARSRGAALASASRWADSLATCRLDGVTVPVSQIRPGDRVEVRPGERIPVDGVIRDGVGFVAESVVTGEPFSNVRRPGDSVLAGAASEDARFVVEATAPGSDRQIDRLIAAVEDARLKPASIQSRADRLARVILPLIVGVSVVTFVGWAYADGWEVGLFRSMSVLLVACPCALGLATPVLVWTALNRLAERGLILNAGDGVERLAEVEAVAFDKTGTLTEDRFSLVDIVTAGSELERTRLLGWLSAVEAQCSHPVARAFAALPRPDGIVVRSLRVEPGCGVVADVDGHTLRAGRPEWIAAQVNGTRSDSCPLPPCGGGLGWGVTSARPTATGSSAIVGRDSGPVRSACVTPHPNPPPQGGRGQDGSDSHLDAHGELLSQLVTADGHRIDVEVDGRLAAVAVLRERLRGSAVEALEQLDRMGLRVAVLTGDTPGRAERLGLDAESGMTPDGKRRRVESMGRVLAVGDGVNDAGMLAVAHVGVALSSGAELAEGAASATLFNPDLRVLPWAVALARNTVRQVRRNLWTAAGYNTVGIMLAASGLLHPVAAAVLMVVSSLAVVWSSTRLTVTDQDCGCGASGGRREPVRPAYVTPHPTPPRKGGRGQDGRALVHTLAVVLQTFIAVQMFGPAGYALLALLPMTFLWHRWRGIPHDLDMAFGMLTVGNLGMLAGWWADGPACCSDGVGMWFGMLAGGTAAMACLLRTVAPGGCHRVAMFTGGNAGMLAGMAAGGLLGDTPLSSFAGMTAGMLAGMWAGTAVTTAALTYARTT